MSEQRDETRIPGCKYGPTQCRFRAHGGDDFGYMRCETCGREQIPLQDALNAMFARLEAAEKR